MAMLCYVRGEIGFELEQEVFILGGFFLLGERRGDEKEQKENCDDDSVHRNFSGRSSGGFGHARR
jgi:hypothetical protein